MKFHVESEFEVENGQIQHPEGKNRKNMIRDAFSSAQIEVLVTFLLVNFFVFLVIPRDHGSFEGRH